VRNPHGSFCGFRKLAGFAVVFARRSSHFSFQIQHFIKFGAMARSMNYTESARAIPAGHKAAESF
jgi:hypothetical protein